MKRFIEHFQNFEKQSTTENNSINLDKYTIKKSMHNYTKKYTFINYFYNKCLINNSYYFINPSN